MTERENRLSRRNALKATAAAGAAIALTRLDAFAAGLSAGVAPAAHGLPGATAAPAAPFARAVIERAIPSSGEKLPIIGMGTARNYENPTPEQIPPLREVLRQFPVLGGRVIDTAPAYGRAETVVGDLLAELKNRDKYFIATKVSVRGGGGREAAVASLAESMKRLKTDRIDLMQVWNMSSPDLLMPILDEWKAAKQIRYTGVTTSNDSQYAALEALMKARTFDFIQVDLAIDNRGSLERLIPLAADRGMGVLINLPFGRSRPFQKVQGKPLPGWAKDIDCTTWAQVFLKYILGNPAITAVIPGTEKVEYLTENIGAGMGRLPDAAMRKRIEQDFDAIAM